jgi:hypothetical protein
MAGWRYRFLGLHQQFPAPSLRVRWIRTTSKPAAYRAEARVLVDYVRIHHELPPLNYKFNWALFEEMDKANRKRGG